LKYLGNSAEFLGRDAGGLTEFEEVLLTDEGPTFLESAGTIGNESGIGPSRIREQTRRSVVSHDPQCNYHADVVMRDAHSDINWQWIKDLRH
jgi:hypothetical protein